MGPMRRLAVCLLGAALLGGCEFRPLPLAAEADGPAAIRPAGADGAPGALAPARRDGCDPVAQNCPSGGRCIPDCNRQAYLCVQPNPGATRTQGVVCQEEEQCAIGLACVDQSGSGSSASRCLRYCRDSDDCPRGTRCVSLPLRCDPGDERRTLARRLCVYTG